MSDLKAAAVETKHPKGLYYLFCTEAMERFSYYGMRAILVLYLVAKVTDGGMGMGREDALSIYATYTGLVYLTPLIGGFLADKYLGARKAIFIGGLVMMLGEIAMMFPSTLNLGLALLILGNGFFKPNITTIVGHLYEDNDPRRDGAFTLFYMGINVGGFFSPLVCGTIAAHAGYRYGFMAAAIGMAIGVGIFLFGQRKFSTAGFPPGREVTAQSLLTKKDALHIFLFTLGTVAFGYLCVLAIPYVSAAFKAIPDLIKMIIGIALLVGVITGLFGIAYRGGKKEGGKEQAMLDAKSVGAILILSLFVIFFWLGFEQAGGTMTLFAEEQTQRALPIFNFEIPSSWFQAVNPIFIVILAPLFSKLWFKIDSSKHSFSVLYKMCIAFCLLGLGFALLYVGQHSVVQDANGDYIEKASMFFLVGVYFLHTCGELCLSPVGLSLVTKLSPARMVSLMMGVWFLSSACANYMAGNLENFLKAYDINIFAFLIVSSLGAAVVLFAVSPLLKRWMKGC